MTTFAEDIEAVAAGEQIESIVVGSFGWDHGTSASDKDAYGWSSDRTPIPKKLKGIPVSWQDIRSYLDYQYDVGYGGPNCHAIYAYTENYVISVSEYDGSTGVIRTPRNPIKCNPVMS